jgi:hypothetical protein
MDPILVEMVELSRIRLDQRAQLRKSLSTDTAEDYAEAMQAGEAFPSLMVFHDSGSYWLADGFHGRGHQSPSM